MHQRAALKTGVLFNPLDPGFRADPYPAYARLRQEAPYLRTLGTLVLTRYQDVLAVLKSRQFSVDLIPQTIVRHAQKLGAGGTDQVVRFIRNSIVFTDSPEHVRLRQLVNQAYTPPIVEAMAPRIYERVTTLLDKAESRAGVGEVIDFVRDVAAPLPVHVLCDWMCVPEEMHETIGRHIHRIRYLLDPGLMTASDFRAVIESMSTLTAFFEDHARAVRGVTDGNLVARLSAAEHNGDRLGEEEVAFACIMSFVAGTETSQGLIGNVLHILLDEPEQFATLRRERERLTSAVEEAIRFETPLQMTKRVAMRDVSIRDVEIKAGEQVLLCLASANRDPTAFDKPDSYDLGRKGPPHVGFGYGMHSCLGGMLARLQSEVAIDAVMDRYSDIRRGQKPPVWQKHSLILRALESLPAVPVRTSVKAGPSTKQGNGTSAPGVTIFGSIPQEARLAVVGFHHAGGSALSLASCPRNLPGDIAFLRAELPGRNPVSGAAPAREIAAILPDLIAAMRAYVLDIERPLPFAFYGHSLGALIAFELTRELREQGLTLPIGLAVTSRRAPQCPLSQEALCLLPDDHLKSSLKALGGLTQIDGKSGWLDSFLGTIRADLAMSDLYEYVPAPPLPCPILAFKGREDPIVSIDELAAWRHQTSVRFDMAEVSGSHFFNAEGTVALREAAIACLVSWLNEDAMKGSLQSRNGSGQGEGPDHAVAPNTLP
jgi:cytochrome P450/surfactin synthase thioesterase subunit